MASQATAPEGTKLTITLPDDFHHHFRDGPSTANVLEHATQQFGRCIAMPNLRPPVTTTEMALEYRQRILSSLPKELPHGSFEPLMTLISPIILLRMRSKRHLQLDTSRHEIGMVLCIHSEVSTPGIDIFDREPVFIEEIIKPLASITCHHLLYNRNALLVGGIKPHFYCLPILKRETHREALLGAATSGSNKFFLGTDSAPHAVEVKEAACGCAGAYTAHCAVQLYAEAFDSMGALDKLEAFCSFHGADHYQLSRNTQKITLEKKSWIVPKRYSFGISQLVPIRAGESVAWSIVSN
ncbi:dihydroorotase [Skeletonema marinoi]|uniref:dihydroorotase n=1 Tax=Skeletonema marinoi TaxID=267567 RepID=A0AAD8YNU9_9STRA|nr:dihydroorotase [Skeletonema marinoi]